MLNLFKNFDIFQREPRLYFSGQETFQTKYGMVTGIMTILCCVSFISYFVTDYYQKTSINIIQNNVFYENPKFDFENLHFAFSLQNFKGESIKPSHYYFTLMMYIFKPEEKGKSTTINLKVEKCNRNTHFKKYTSLLEEFDLDLYYCLKPGQVDKNMTVYGNFGDLNKGYGYVNLYTSKCKNNSIYNSENVTCAPQYEIDGLLDKTIYLRLAYLDYDIDHNEKVPAVPFFKTEAQQVTTKFYPRIYYNMRNDLYRTDNGILGESFEEMSYTTFDKISNILTINPFVVTDAFTLFSIIVSPNGIKYTRSYVKIQTLLANIGGVINAVIIIMKFVSYRISDKIIIAHNINQTFKIAKFENQNKDINSFSKSHFNISNLGKVKFNNYHKTDPITLNSSLSNQEKDKITENKNLENSNNQILSSNRDRKLSELKTELYVRKKLKLNIKQLLCPGNFVSQNETYDEFSLKIKKFLSCDYIIKNFIQLQIMKIVLLGESDSFVLSNLPYITPQLDHRIFYFEKSKIGENHKKVGDILQSNESKVSQLLNENLWS